MLLHIDLEREGIAFSGIYRKSGEKGWPEKGGMCLRRNEYLSVEKIGMAKREKSLSSHQSIIYRSKGVASNLMTAYPG